MRRTPAPPHPIVAPSSSITLYRQVITAWSHRTLRSNHQFIAARAQVESSPYHLSRPSVASAHPLPVTQTSPFHVLWSLSDIDHSTAANNPRPSASCSARKNPQRIPANTPPVFPGLRPRIWPHLLRLVTNGNVGQAPSLNHSRSRDIHDLIVMLIHRHSQLALIIYDGSSRNCGVARDKREERDSRDV